MNFNTHRVALAAGAAAILTSFAVIAQTQQTAPIPPSSPAPAGSATTPAPSAGATATGAAIPALQCEKPAESLLSDPTPEHVKRLQKEVDGYKTCVNEYARTMGAKANELAGQSRAYAAAANGAIESYNTFVTALNAKAKGDGGDIGTSPSSRPAVTPKY